ncbi:hypothetical protein WA158_002465 [Blastocystis sp. Blastoise]
MVNKSVLHASLINIFAGAISGYNTGIVAGLTYPLIKCNLFDGPLSENDIAFYQGLFNSLILVFAMFSSPIAVWFAGKVGLKIPLFVLAVISILCPIALIMYDNYWYMTIIRGVMGIAIGFISALCPMYTNLTVGNEVKGKVATTLQIAICTSICIAQVFNYFFTPAFTTTSCTPLTFMQYGIQLAFGAIFGILLLITLFWIPNVMPHSSSSNIPRKANNTQETVQSLFSVANMKWLFFALMLAVVNQFTGINGVIYYSPQILTEAGIENALMVNILVVGVWNTLTVFIFMALVDKLSRKMILNISLAIMVVGSILLIVTFYITGYTGLAIGGVVMFILGFETGPGPLFYVMASQDFPKDIMDKGLGLANVLLWVLNIVISFVFPIVNSSFGPAITFIILAVIQVLCIVYFNIFKGESSKQ